MSHIGRVVTVDQLQRRRTFRDAATEWVCTGSDDL
jgi:hypothetical protein